MLIKMLNTRQLIFMFKNLKLHFKAMMTIMLLPTDRYAMDDQRQQEPYWIQENI